jgi:hypothetical protein
MLAFRDKALDVAVVQGEVHDQPPTVEGAIVQGEVHNQPPPPQQSKGGCTTSPKKSRQFITSKKFRLINYLGMILINQMSVLVLRRV